MRNDCQRTIWIRQRKKKRQTTSQFHAISHRQRQRHRQNGENRGKKNCVEIDQKKKEVEKIIQKSNRTKRTLHVIRPNFALHSSRFYFVSFRFSDFFFQFGKRARKRLFRAFARSEQFNFEWIQRKNRRKMRRICFILLCCFARSLATKIRDKVLCYDRIKTRKRTQKWNVLFGHLFCVFRFFLLCCFFSFRQRWRHRPWFIWLKLFLLCVVVCAQRLFVLRWLLSNAWKISLVRPFHLLRLGRSHRIPDESNGHWRWNIDALSAFSSFRTFSKIMNIYGDTSSSSSQQISTRLTAFAWILFRCSKITNFKSVPCLCFDDKSFLRYFRFIWMMH